MGSHHGKPNGNAVRVWEHGFVGHQETLCLVMDSSDLDSIRWVSGRILHEGYILENGGSVKGLCINICRIKFHLRLRFVLGT